MEVGRPQVVVVIPVRMPMVSLKMLIIMSTF
jgi:hypothetical protein